MKEYWLENRNHDGEWQMLDGEDTVSESFASCRAAELSKNAGYGTVRVMSKKGEVTVYSMGKMCHQLEDVSIHGRKVSDLKVAEYEVELCKIDVELHKLQKRKKVVLKMQNKWTKHDELLAKNKENQK